MKNLIEFNSLNEEEGKDMSAAYKESLSTLEKSMMNLDKRGDEGWIGPMFKQMYDVIKYQADIIDLLTADKE